MATFMRNGTSKTCKKQLCEDRMSLAVRSYSHTETLQQNYKSKKHMITIPFNFAYIQFICIKNKNAFCKHCRTHAWSTEIRHYKDDFLKFL